MDPSQHADERRPWLEQVVRQLPGFKGYLAREDRRESDQLARAAAVEAIQRAKQRVDHYQRTLMEARELDLMPRCEQIRSRLDLLQSRLKGAMRGYSGFFDLVQVDESVLDRIYVLDLGVVDQAQALAAKAEALAADADSSGALAGILQHSEDLGQRIDERTKLLEGMR